MHFINYNGEDMFYHQIGDTITWPYGRPLDRKFLEILALLEARCIQFKPSFNHDISGLPSCIKRIVFPVNSDFNQPLNNLSPGLKELELYDKFNQPLDNLPHGLIRLVINSDFNYPLEHLPATLKYLEIRGEFNHPLNRETLPAGLEELVLRDVYDYEDVYIRSCILRDLGSAHSKYSYGSVHIQF
jgi:hypothetical protein